MASNARRGGYGGNNANGGGRAGSGAHLLSFNYGASNREQLFDADSDARADRSSHHPRRGGGGSGGGHSNQNRRSGGGGGGAAPPTDPAQQERAAAIQRFQFIISRDDLGHPALRDAMMAPDAPPPWEIVKFVVVRCPLDDFACPICLEQPVAAVASVTCGHVYCLKCVFSLAIHGWDKQRLKQAGSTATPPPPALVAAAPPMNSDGPFIDGLTDRALGQYVRGGCPMCHKSMSLRELVPALHVPVAPLRSGDRVTFVPVRATLPMPIAVYGTPGADCCRINVEADETLAWATQQAFELGDEADAALEGITAAELSLEMAIVNEAARLAAEEESRPEHQKSANTAAALFASTRASRPQEECENVKEARLGIRAAKIEAEAVRLARSFWVAFVEASSNAADAGPLTEADLDVFALYGGQVAPTPPGTPARTHSADFSKAASSSSCNMGRQTSSASIGGAGGGKKPTVAAVSLGEPCNEHWTYRAGSGAQAFLHPLATRLIIESALERKGYTVAPPPLASTAASFESPPPHPSMMGGSGGFGDDVHYDTAASSAAPSPQVGSMPASPPPLLTAADLPRSVTVKVAEIEEVEQTRQSRFRDKAHALLPVGGRFSLVFPEAMPDSTTRDVRQRHKRAFDARARRRHDKSRRETDEESRARQREDERARRRNEADPTRHVSAIPAAQYYVTGDDGFETFEIPPDLSESPEVLATSAGAPPPAVVSPPTGPRAAVAWAPKNRNLLAEDDSAPSLLGPPSAASGNDTTATTSAAPPSAPPKWGAKPKPAPTATSRDKVNPWGTAPPSSAAGAKKRPPSAQ